MTDPERAADAARAQPPSHRAPVTWALTADCPLRLGEAEARIVLQDRSLVRAVRFGGEKLRAEHEGRTADPERWRRRGGSPRWVPIVLLLLVLAIPLQSSPIGRFAPYAGAEAAPGFLILLGASYALVSLLHLGLLLRWVRNPLRSAGTRLVSSLLTLVMLLVLPWFAVPAAVMAPPVVAALGLIPFALAMGLAALNLWAARSERTNAEGVRAAIDEVGTLLWEDTAAARRRAGAADVRGAAGELRRTLRRLPEAERHALESTCAAVLDALEQRGAVSAELVARARTTPLGRWHELDGAAADDD
ncbi:hypothetical protein M4D54_03480 [Brachybacterium sp. p3-SID1565]|uniref:hypothetical protein n=1 Tax=Brachybacterium sp. p3-SID1565 TaxID=2916046 RepID=UPI0021A64454|nr:hypothetical protein [Brachybacterium sp. p3-SID1565]MCT1384700.1 hypothetical protein [Brachybacterium sp. p3-SID1565]